MSPCNFICLLKLKCGKLLQTEVRLSLPGFGGGVCVLLLLFICLFFIFLYDLQKEKKI